MSDRTNAGKVPGAGQLAGKMAALSDVIDEVSRIHFRLGALAERIHHDGVSSSGRRALLRNVIELGPKTVPELARMRPVSRQFIQTLVNGLVEDGWVTLEPNPAHKRSRLVAPTALGRRMFAKMTAKEAPAAAYLAGGFDDETLRQAADFLSRFRERVDDYDTGGK